MFNLNSLMPRGACFGLCFVLMGLGLTSCRTPEPAGEFSFVQLCDTQLGMGGYEHDVATFTEAVDQINRLNPDFVLICGDLVQDRNEKSFADFKRIRNGFNVPCHCAPGNHDVGNKPTAESLAYYRSVIGEDYYSFDHKGHTFVIVNTQLWKVDVPEESELQDAWLEEVLKTADGKDAPVFVVGHYPLFLGDPDEAEEYMNLPVAKRQELLDLFERHGVVAVLGGHTHKLTINEYNGIQMVNGETTSKNFDKRPMGFRLWRVPESGKAAHTFVPLESEIKEEHVQN